ncbi:MAG TPA: hypothetical protein VG841_07385 [Caulobacterales bacterium]|nr:hypothetical protein [Caulobacterales bacterium]
MKVLIGAIAAAALMLGGVAEAQTAATTTPAPAAAAAASIPPSRCPAAIAPPNIPDGATADQRAMTAAYEAFDAWRQAALEIVNCRRAEHDEGVDFVRAREAEYSAMSESMNATINAWNTAHDAYCGRRGNHCTDAAQSNAHH